MTAIVFFGAVQIIVSGIIGECIPWFDEAVTRGGSFGLPMEFASIGAMIRGNLWERARRTAARAPETLSSAGTEAGSVAPNPLRTGCTEIFMGKTGF
nr:hypothetical protein [uncultured Rhodopila sp.]